MKLDARTLRPYAAPLVLLVTVAAGWTIVIRPLAAEERGAAERLASLRQREMMLRWEMSEPSPSGVDVDPVAAFERRVASGDAAPALVERLARLASTARARNLLIETAESAAAVGGPTQTGPQAAPQRDPRFALFDTPVWYVPIRMVFDTDFASLGRFLWACRNLPTTIEIRELSVGLPPADGGDDAVAVRSDLLRASLTLHAYSRSAPAGTRASSTVTR